MVSQLSEIWSEFSIPDPDPGSGSWLFTYPRSRSWIPDPESRDQKGTGSWIRICNIGDFRFAQAAGGSVGYWLSTGAAVLKTHSMDQLSEAFMCQKEFSDIFYFYIISLTFTLFKLWCPAHLFPNTPRRYSVHCPEGIFFCRSTRGSTTRSTFWTCAMPNSQNSSTLRTPRPQSSRTSTRMQSTPSTK